MTVDKFVVKWRVGWLLEMIDKRLCNKKVDINDTRYYTTS